MAAGDVGSALALGAHGAGKDLAEAERLLGISGVRANLVEKEIMAGGDRMTLQLRPIQATHARDALVKQLYARVFDHLVHCINHALSTKKP